MSSADKSKRAVGDSDTPKFSEKELAQYRSQKPRQPQSQAALPTAFEQADAGGMILQTGSLSTEDPPQASKGKPDKPRPFPRKWPKHADLVREVIEVGIRIPFQDMEGVRSKAPIVKVGTTSDEDTEVIHEDLKLVSENDLLQAIETACPDTLRVLLKFHMDPACMSDPESRWEICKVLRHFLPFVKGIYQLGLVVRKPGSDGEVIENEAFKPGRSHDLITGMLMGIVAGEKMITNVNTDKDEMWREGPGFPVFTFSHRIFS
jgi:hypothetical protein